MDIEDEWPPREVERGHDRDPWQGILRRIGYQSPGSTAVGGQRPAKNGYRSKVGHGVLTLEDQPVAPGTPVAWLVLRDVGFPWWSRGARPRPTGRNVASDICMRDTGCNSSWQPPLRNPQRIMKRSGRGVIAGGARRS